MEAKRIRQLIGFIIALAATLFTGFGLVTSAIDGKQQNDSFSGLTALGLIPFFLTALYFTVKTIKPLLKNK